MMKLEMMSSAKLCQIIREQQQKIDKLETKLNTTISALKHLRHMDTWQNVKQINDFLDETLKGIE